MTITITATSIGAQAGPFTITDNLSNTIATGVTRQQILDGYTVVVNDLATNIYLTSTGVCTNETGTSIGEIVLRDMYINEFPNPVWEYQTCNPSLVDYLVSTDGAGIILQVGDKVYTHLMPGSPIVQGWHLFEDFNSTIRRCLIDDVIPGKVLQILEC
jgi:hypothetical protein